MNIIKKIFPVGLATLVILLAVAFSTSADETDKVQKGHQFNPENREAVMETIKNNDYDAWAALMADSKYGAKVLEVINADNFGRFVEMHQLREQARAIAEELGLPQHKKMMKGKMMKGKFHQGQRPELTDEQKALMEQVRELKKAGDIEGAKELLEKAGIQFGKFQKFRGQHNWKGQMNQE